jgi:hypothetical protein
MINAILIAYLIYGSFVAGMGYGILGKRMNARIFFAVFLLWPLMFVGRQTSDMLSRIAGVSRWS